MSLLLYNLVLPLADFTLRLDVEFARPVTGLTGPSGSGKTSLLELVAGLRRPAQGSITLDGKSLADISAGWWLPPEKRRVGYVPQDLALFPHLNVQANLRYGLHNDEAGSRLLAKVVEVLELPGMMSRAVTSLSGGEKQRVALGRALLARPAILLLDEPLSHLDDRLKTKILPYLQQIWAMFQVPMIYVTHSPTELREICEEAWTLQKGKLQPL